MISRWVSQLLDECIVQITVQEQNGRLPLLPGPGQNKAKKLVIKVLFRFFSIDEETGEVLKRTSLNR